MEESQPVRVHESKRFEEFKDDEYSLYLGRAEDFLASLPNEPIFDLIVTSPPYNIGKSYEVRTELDEYLQWQRSIIDELVPRLKSGGSICWQVGNYVQNGEIVPLDIEFDPIFRREHGLVLRNRIVWHYRHGLHARRRFSGRYEVVMWYTNPGPDYTFNLDPVRIPSRYPGKRHSKGPKAGQLSGNPRGKNPEDVWDVPELNGEYLMGPDFNYWDIPNVKSGHVEKTEHPCQFPVGLVERLVLALTNQGDLVFDPFAGVGSAGVAAALHRRRFWGCEILPEYIETGAIRIEDALEGVAKVRPMDRPVYDPAQSNLSKIPQEWRENEATSTRAQGGHETDVWDRSKAQSSTGKPNSSKSRGNDRGGAKPRSERRSSD